MEQGGFWQNFKVAFSYGLGGGLGGGFGWRIGDWVAGLVIRVLKLVALIVAGAAVSLYAGLHHSLPVDRPIVTSHYHQQHKVEVRHGR